MRVPVNERVKDVPASALRAMFAGIGSLLSVTDRIRPKHAAPEAAAEPETPAPAAEATAAAEAPAEPEVVAEPEASVGPEVVAEPEASVGPEVVAEPEASVGPEVVAEPEASVGPEVVAEPEASVGPEVVAEPQASVGPEVVEPQASVGPEAEPAALPIANYDELSIASLRARLRNLSLEQLAELVSYEKAHAAREDVVAMFERRIAKVQSEA